MLGSVSSKDKGSIDNQIRSTGSRGEQGAPARGKGRGQAKPALRRGALAAALQEWVPLAARAPILPIARVRTLPTMSQCHSVARRERKGDKDLKHDGKAERGKSQCLLHLNAFINVAEHEKTPYLCQALWT